MAKKGLGRGLDVLLPSFESFDESSIKQIPIEFIDPNKNQPRQKFDKEALQQLADSIKENGIISPIIVVQNNDRYTIVAGERRFRAARIADLQTLPCIVKNFSKSEIMQVALIENIQRENLNPVEEAEAIQKLIDDFAYTQDAVAKALGKSRSSIANSLRILNLQTHVLNFVRNGEILFGHAKVLAGVSDKKLQLNLAQICISENLNVRQLEALIAKKPKNKSNTKIVMDADLKAFETTIKQAFGLKTKLSGTAQKGKIVLSYNTKEELDNLYNIIEGLH